MWSVTADLAHKFRDEVVTKGSAHTANEAAALAEAGYDKLMWLYDRANEQSMPA
jgi:hypothetical protein